MRKRLKILAVLMAVIAIFSSIAPAAEARAEDLTGTAEHAKYLLRVVSRHSHFLEKEEDYQLENFDPAGDIGYGEIAQWFWRAYDYDEWYLWHGRYNDGVALGYPSVKKAIRRMKEACFTIACKYPEYATEIADMFMDGQKKFSAKRKVSYDWIMNMSYIMCYYAGGVYSEVHEFDMDMEAFSLFMFGVDENGKTRHLPEITHRIWQRSYSKNNKKPNRVEAIDMMDTMYTHWQNLVNF